MSFAVGRFVFGAFVTALVLLCTRSVRAGGWWGGIGVVGDSYSDEYQFYPPDRARARNWVEILAATRELDFGEFSREDRGDARGAGFAYNWAKSAATTADMLADGQHTGVAGQVRSGQVGLVWIFIGGNDFIEALRGELPCASWDTVADQAAQNVEAALAAILDASSTVRVVLVTLPDIFQIPEIRDECDRGEVAAEVVARVQAAIGRYNARLRSWPDRDDRVMALDLARMTALSRLISPREIPVGRRRVDRDRAGTDLSAAFLADRRHTGTLVQGVFAQFFLATMNQHLGANLPPLTGQEIEALVNAEALASTRATGTVSPASVAGFSLGDANP